MKSTLKIYWASTPRAQWKQIRRLERRCCHFIWSGWFCFWLWQQVVIASKGYGNGDEGSHLSCRHVGDENSKTSIISGGVTTIAGGQVVVRVFIWMLLLLILRVNKTPLNLKVNNKTSKDKSPWVTVLLARSGYCTVNLKWMPITPPCENSQVISLVMMVTKLVLKSKPLKKGGLITSTKAAEDAGKNI